MALKPFDLSVYLVLDPLLCGERGMIDTTRAAVAGGVTMVQLRLKEFDTQAMIEVGRALKEVLAGTGVPLIVNDDAQAAVALDAEGLHIGQGDMSPAAARQLIGPGRILGLSVSTEREVAVVDTGVIDYLGVGPVFATATKPGHPEPIGFAGLGKVAAASPLPVVAIGGIKAEHVAAALRAGAQGVAVVSAICGQPDPRAAAGAFASAFKEHRL